MREKSKQKQLEEELKRACKADKEVNDVLQYYFIDKVMENIETIRKKRFKDFPDNYTQKKVAKRAGISRSTYTNYVQSRSYDISLLTVWKIAQILDCNLSDILGFALKEPAE